MNKHNVLDLFCGTSGFSHGFIKRSESFGLICAIDILRVATQTAQENNPNTCVICQDIKQIKPSSLKTKLRNQPIDVIIGGPPCQGFSSLRPFRSSKDEDPRNTLFENYALFVNYFRPKIFVMENVVGLLTHNNGNTLNEIQDCFQKMHYETDWRILNAASYGVPQKRERFILIGVQSGAKIIFPKPTHSFSGRIVGYKDNQRIIRSSIEGDLGPLFKHSSNSNQTLSPAITVMGAIGDLPPLNSGESINKYLHPPSNAYQQLRRGEATMLTLHEAANHSLKTLEIIKHSGSNINSIPKHLITSGFSSCYSRLAGDEPSVTITVKFMSASSNKCIHPFQNRTITPREAARIQSFDDDFHFLGSRTEIVTQIGNAVPPLLGYAIAGALNEMLG
jgi:DNA (cytosine-5)-methyltransferase 1